MPARAVLARPAVWKRRFAPKGGMAQATEVAVNPAGTEVFIAGTSNVPATFSEPRFVTIAYDRTTGERLWKATGPVGNPTGIAVSDDGSEVFVAGSHGMARGSGYLTMAYAADSGTLLWARRYDGKDLGGQADAIATDGQQVFVTGTSEGHSSADVATVSYDADSGATDWVRRYDGPDHGGDRGNDIAVSGIGVFVTGSSADAAGNGDYLTIAYEAATGVRRWVAHYDDRRHLEDDAAAIAAAPDGSAVFITGPAGQHGATISYDAATGSTRWIAKYHRGDDLSVALASAVVTSDGARLVAEGLGTVVAFDATNGHVDWVVRTSDMYTTALAIDPDGSAAFVAGRVCAAGCGLAVLALDVDTGATLWSGEVGETGGGNAIAIAPDGGDVFVTGFGFTPTGPETESVHMLTAAFGT
jgi:outer membrane protein assembly factor BamB